jgi:hypothetical protein
MVQTRSTANAQVMVDDRYLPLVISSFRGELDLEDARWQHYAVEPIVAKALRDDTGIVLITDAAGMKAPSAVVRKFWAESMDAHPERMTEMTGVFVVLDSSILRGALTALVWLSRQTKRIRYFPSLPAAIDEGVALLHRQGFASPLLRGTSYHPPPIAAKRLKPGAAPAWITGGGEEAVGAPKRNV